MSEIKITWVSTGIPGEIVPKPINPMVERVADVICDELDDDWHTYELYRRMARAAIKAMREPIEEIFSECGRCGAPNCSCYAKDALESIFDQALKE